MINESFTDIGEIESFIQDRYASYSTGIGWKIVNGEVDFKDLEAYALQNSGITNKSGKQELLEAVVNRYI
ncbi:MAG: hypothetical protein V3S41_01215 [Spirochaetia bacterium]